MHVIVHFELILVVCVQRVAQRFVVSLTQALVD